MTTPSREDDDRLLEELRAALRATGDPAASTAAGAAAWTWRTVEAELAEIDDDPPPIRTGDGSSAEDYDLARGSAIRSLRFTAPGATVELEQADEEWLGVVVPPVADRVTVLAADGTALEECPVDDVGTFTLTRPVSGPVRLRFPTASGELLTDWCLLR